MLRITTHILLWTRSDFRQPGNLCTAVLLLATIVLSFLVSPILGIAVLGLMIWHSSKGSIRINSERRSAEMELQIGSGDTETSDAP